MSSQNNIGMLGKMNTTISSKLRCRLAESSDDDSILKFSKDFPCDGLFQFSLDRDPSFLRALVVEGHKHEVIISEDANTRNMVGICTTSEKPCFVNSQLCQIGYLGNLRILPEYQGGMILARGYQLLKKRHKQAFQAKVHLTTIFESNKKARQILESKRSILPVYQDIGRFTTFTFKPHAFLRRFSPNTIDTLEFSLCQESELLELVKFLDLEGKLHEFFPNYQVSDFTTDTGLLRGLKPSDIALAKKDNKIVGCLALWDQRSFRQWKIQRYHKIISKFRTFINWGLKLFDYPELPVEGHILPYYLCSLVCIKGNDQKIFAGLLSHLLTNLHSPNGLVAAGFHANHPFYSVMQTIRNISFQSRLYMVYWAEDVRDVPIIQHDIYIELGSL